MENIDKIFTLEAVTSWSFWSIPVTTLSVTLGIMIVLSTILISLSNSEAGPGDESILGTLAALTFSITFLATLISLPFAYSSLSNARTENAQETIKSIEETYDINIVGSSLSELLYDASNAENFRQSIFRSAEPEGPVVMKYIYEGSLYSTLIEPVMIDHTHNVSSSFQLFMLGENATTAIVPFAPGIHGESGELLSTETEKP